MFANKSKMPLPFIGLLQAIAVMVYVLLVAAFMWNMDKIDFEVSGVLGAALMLFLLVLSAAICGPLVFGYPLYLVLDKKVKEALVILGYTFIYSLIIITIFLTTIFF